MSCGRPVLSKKVNFIFGLSHNTIKQWNKAYKKYDQRNYIAKIYDLMPGARITWLGWGGARELYLCEFESVDETKKVKTKKKFFISKFPQFRSSSKNLAIFHEFWGENQKKKIKRSLSQDIRELSWNPSWVYKNYKKKQFMPTSSVPRIFERGGQEIQKIWE